MTDWLDSEEFFALCESYRSIGLCDHNNRGLCGCYEEAESEIRQQLKSEIRKHFIPRPRWRLFKDEKPKPGPFYYLLQYDRTTDVPESVDFTEEGKWKFDRIEFTCEPKYNDRWIPFWEVFPK